MAFLTYLFTLFLVHLYMTTGRNADPTRVSGGNIVFSASSNAEIELTSPRDASKWYTPVSREEDLAHIIGEDEGRIA